MVKKYIKHLALGVISIVLAACSISPDIEDRPELKPIVTSIAAPAIASVINNHSEDSPSIDILWDPVDKATFYVVEYQTALDYLAGNDFRTFITQTNSFTLGSQYFSNPSDMRYVFRVKAGSQTQSNSSVLYSPYSELKEGVIVNSFTVSPVLEESILTVYSSFPKIRSVLADFNIVTPSVKYYDGDYSGDSTLPEPLSSSSMKLNSAEEKTITAVLSIDGDEVARKTVYVQNSVDYYPQPLTYISGSVNQRGAITVEWRSPDINKGLDAYNAVLKFSIERMKDGENTWIPLKDSSGNDLLLFDGIENSNFAKSEDGLYSYIDETAAPADKGKENHYKYRITPKYCLTVNGNEIVYSGDESESNITQICYVQDDEVKSFEARTVSGFDASSPVTSGDAEYVVDLSWSSYHELPDNIVYVVTRWDYDKITSSNSSPADAYSSEDYDLVYEGSGKSCRDTFTLSEEDNKKAHNYTYYIQLKNNESAADAYSKYQIEKVNEKEGVVSIRTNPSMKEVDFIKSFTATDGDTAFSDKILISWEYNTEAIEAAGLDVNKVSVHILKKSASDDQHQDIHKGTEGITGTSYEDKDVTSGDSYNYMIRPCYNDESSPYDGDQAAYSETVTGSTLDGVTGLTASLNTSNSEISVTWNATGYAHGYQVYYRERGASSWNEARNTKNTSIQLTSADDGIAAGKIYEITVGVIDASGRSKPVDSIAVNGAILGQITPEASGDNNIKSDSIEVAWAIVENATSYKISIIDDEDNIFVEKTLRLNELTESDGNYIYVFSSDSDEFRAYAETIENGKLKNRYALSRKYKFKVSPVVRDGSSVVEPLGEATAVDGYWVMPPKNITATKAYYRDLITISWDAVENASGYVIYSKQHNSSDSWKYLNTVSGNVTHFDYLNSSDNLDFTISAFVGSQEGLVQNFFENESNYGYPLIAPQRVTCVDLGNGFFKLSFMEVIGATDYIINFDETQYDVLSSDKVNQAPVLLTDYSDKAVERSADGLISYYIKRPEVKYRVSFNCTVAARNSSAAITSKNTTSAMLATVMYASISEDDQIKLALYNLNYIFTSVNSYFGNEWWPDSQKTLSYSGLSASTCWGTSGFAKYNPANNGYVKLSNYSLFGNTVTGDISCYVEKNQASGYLGDDPLERITSSSDIVISLPGKYEDITVSFDEYYVGNTNGTIRINGNVLNLSDVSPKLLEEVK